MIEARVRRLPGYVEVESYKETGPGARLRRYASRLVGDMQPARASMSDTDDEAVVSPLQWGKYLDFLPVPAESEHRTSKGRHCCKQQGTGRDTITHVALMCYLQAVVLLPASLSCGHVGCRLEWQP